jgi:phospholipase C
VISPFVPRNVIDHCLYDHASIPATVEALFGLPAMTQRDTNANRVDALFSLTAPRTDAPTTLPAPATPAAVMSLSAPDLGTVATANPQGDVNQGNLPGILHAAMRQDIELSPQNKPQILARVRGIKTREQARQYLAEVQSKVRARRAQSSNQ